MTPSVLLLLFIIGFYAAYNLLVKASSGYTLSASSPILATISLQLAALSVSLIYLCYLVEQKAVISVPTKAYLLAIGGGVCIGLAEVLYFYLFRGVGGDKPMAASVAVPLVVGGTIIVAVLASYVVFKESLNVGQWIGIGLGFIGMVVLAVSSRQSI